MRQFALVLGLLGTLLSAPAFGQAYRHELGFFGNWTSMKQSGQSTSVGILNVGYGYYFTPQLLGTLGVTRVSTDGFGYTDYGVGAKYYFGIGRRDTWVPFLDGQIGKEKTAASSDRRWQVGGGLAYFVTESTSFDAGLHWFSVGTKPSTSGTIFGLGITTRF